MGNIKDYGAFIDSLVDRDRPFLIIKYCLSCLDRTNNAYEVVTMGSSKLNYTPIERNVAIKAIRRHELPLLHKLDSRNMIWGDEEIKIKFKEKGLEI